MDGLYILRGRVPVPCDLMTWMCWHESLENRRVAYDEIGVAQVSTIFLGVDLSLDGDGSQLFETMVFFGAGFENAHMNRCATWEQAEQMHAEAIKIVKDAQAQTSAVLDDKSKSH